MKACFGKIFQNSALSWMLLAFLCFGARAGAAQTFDEAEIRRQLDRVMFPEQYVISVSDRSSGQRRLNAWTGNLPGLNIGGAFQLQGAGGAAGQDRAAVGGDAIDVLLVIDSGVSRERVELARELVTRIAESAGVTNQMRLNLRQDRILRQPPPELMTLPRRDAPPAEAAPQESAPAEPKGTQTLYDFVENKRDLALRSLLVLWTAIASLLAIGLLIARRNRMNVDIGGEGGLGSAPSGRRGAPSDDNQKSSTKARLAEQDAIAQRGLVQKYSAEIVEQAAKQPSKVALVLSDWIDGSDEGARRAAILLRNCDVVTVEAISQHLHPSDVDKMGSQKIEDFDVYGSDNRAVLEQMREALSRLAANKRIVDRPDPLAILKNVSDTNLAKVLQGEDLASVAAVSVHIPTHRLQKYFSGLSDEQHRLLVAAMSKISTVDVPTLSLIADRLKSRIVHSDQVVIDEEGVVVATRKLIKATKNPKRQMLLAAEVFRLKPNMHKLIRQEYDLACDLMFFAQRPMRVFLQSVDAEKLGTVFGALALPVDAWIAEMPEAMAAAFQDALKREADLAGVEAAWASVQSTLHELMLAGLITNQECQQARGRADREILLSAFTVLNSTGVGEKSTPAGDEHEAA